MEHIGAFEAKTKLSELLDKIERGNDIIITRHGKPIAKLIPYQDNSNTKVNEAISAIRRIRSKLPQFKLNEIKELIRYGREK